MCFLLVASEILADALPPAGRRAEALVGEGRRVQPDASVEHADDDLPLQGKLLLRRRRQAQEVPRPCCLKLIGLAWED